MALLLLRLGFCAALIAAAAAPPAAAQPPPSRPAALDTRAHPAAIRPPTAAERALANQHWDAADAAYAAGDYAKAEGLYRKVLTVLEATWGPAHPRTAALLEWLGSAASAQGRHADAEALYRRTLAIRRATLGERDRDTIGSLADLGFELNAQGRATAAEPLLRQALSLRRAVLGERDPHTAASAVDLASNLQAQGRYAEAEALLRGALTVVEAARGERHLDIAAVLNNLASNLYEQGRYADAEPLLRRALDIRRALLGERDREVGASYNNLGANLRVQGRYAEAELVHRQGLDILREALGERHPETAGSYDNIGGALISQNRYADAEPFLRKALEIRRATLGERHPSTAGSYSNLAVDVNHQRRYAEAEPLYRQALEIRREVLGEAHPRTADSLDNLGVNLSLQGRNSEAEALFRQALASREATLAPGHPVVAAGYHNLALSLDRQGRFAEAEPLYRKDLELSRAALGEQHPDTAKSLDNLARALSARDRFAEAEPYSAKAVEIARALRTREAGARLGAGFGGAEDTSAGQVFEVYLGIASRLADAAPAAAASRRLGEQAFTAAQDLDISAAGQALAQAAARVAAGQAGLGDAVRRRQDLAVQARAYDARLLQALADDDQDTARVMRAELERVGAELGRLDTEIRERFPRYAELVSPNALAIAEVQQRLRPGEGLLLIVPADFDVHLFAVSRTSVSWQRMEGGAEPVAQAVARLRCQVDPSTCAAGGGGGQRTGGPPAFDRGLAHGLYLNLVRPIEPALKGVRTLYVTAVGPVSGLPLGMLLTRPPRGGRAEPRALAASPWLADRYALVTLPSVSTLRALGGLRVEPGVLPLAGFGDPLLGRPEPGAAPRDRGLRAFRSIGVGGVALADPEALRLGLDPLPGTRAELIAMARALEAPDSALHMGAEATETTVKVSSDLSRARVVIFATHGLLPRELKGLDEPGLVFTPPAAASAEDDGVLTASEAARLKLVADWVILSACNTAAADGTPGGEALSGLAKAFLYAGAHALLASHWRVQDDVTSALTVQTLAIQRADPGLSKAQALQKAMRAVRTGTFPDGRRLPGWSADWAHPAAWAPFALVSAGE